MMYLFAARWSGRRPNVLAGCLLLEPQATGKRGDDEGDHSHIQQSPAVCVV